MVCTIICFQPLLIAKVPFQVALMADLAVRSGKMDPDPPMNRSQEEIFTRIGKAPQREQKNLRSWSIIFDYSNAVLPG